MRRLCTAVLVLLATLVVAAPALGKAVTTVTVCGATGCVDRSDRLTGADRSGHALLGVGRVVGDPGRVPYVDLDLGIGDGRDRIFGHQRLRFAPGRGIARDGDGRWHALEPSVVAGYRRLAAGVRAIGAASFADDFPVASGPPLPRAGVREEEEGGTAPVVAVAVGAAAALVVAAVAARGRRRMRRVAAAAYGRRRTRRSVAG